METPGLLFVHTVTEWIVRSACNVSVTALRFACSSRFLHHVHIGGFGSPCSSQLHARLEGCDHDMQLGESDMSTCTPPAGHQCCWRNHCCSADEQSLAFV
jgi:hypothetical protein